MMQKKKNVTAGNDPFMNYYLQPVKILTGVRQVQLESIMIYHLLPVPSLTYTLVYSVRNFCRFFF